mmetsp:Transcript_34905/g.47071  ORF Transcript_34905/g.47071 Transcript_34905/m.47071 type:complete len:130 (+) Transcript_34905:66-455(+)|eukprot:CAMPEP_0176377682 /NCGR_PEP_ID=MMETSP0126-20121128/29072_1 /TAXON_ID=141414 ORGANISM="Strombidinopsis acuminatum, Strain SPMC142" /NCGR_SAMPLE_ID=MMETSP0126 /ASSEMBLY_ACC=CAM_ASM_000229 /LENGTH=129 /DNA_ID=CAMNT_0017739643 /DNA_START=66 /DNA_END=455 /DNA_ORIENTATION=+
MTKKQDYTVKNVCDKAAIYGLDGTLWASSANWKGLNKYNHPLEQPDGSTKEVAYDEFYCAVEAAKGNRNPSEAGIRLGNDKHMFLKNDPDMNVTYLTKLGGGGACLAKTKQALVIGTWDKTAMMSNNLT